MDREIIGMHFIFGLILNSFFPFIKIDNESS
ncbi:uncharacterized protein METZ01_LOCUS92786, partial [marine metagenome]